MGSEMRPAEPRDPTRWYPSKARTAGDEPLRESERDSPRSLEYDYPIARDPIVNFRPAKLNCRVARPAAVFWESHAQ